MYLLKRTMKISFAVLLIVVSLLWMLGIAVFYGDSMMTIEHTELYLGVCFLMLFVSVFLFYSHNRNKKQNSN